MPHLLLFQKIYEKDLSHLIWSTIYYSAYACKYGKTKNKGDLILNISSVLIVENIRTFAIWFPGRKSFKLFKSLGNYFASSFFLTLLNIQIIWIN